ncbi:mechanosensitive ion channel family protein [Mucilaginibacter sp.]|uniref:mechanosensitive ion channel family protein n=1 Tax=Mucilaginibacter sp. TaxID=1882438 RepID=UPI003D12145F
MRNYLYLFLLLFSNSVYAQKPYGPQRDTPSTTSAQKLDFVHMMQKRGHDETVRSIKKYNDGKIDFHQRRAMELLKGINRQAKIVLKEGIDTAGIKVLLDQTTKSIAVVSDGVFINKGTSQTQRNLSVSAAILVEFSKKLEDRKILLDNYTNKVAGFRFKIDSLYSDSVLYVFPNDSVAVKNYIAKIIVVVKETAPIDTAINKALLSLQALQLKVDLLVYQLRSLKEDVDIYSNNLSARAFENEFPFLWEPSGYSRPIKDVIEFSWIKGSLVLYYYFIDHIDEIFVLLVLITAAFYFIRALKRQLANEDKLNTAFSGQLLIRYPWLSATLLTLCVFQFILTDPPFIISFIIWLIAAVCLTFIFHRYIVGYWFRFWIAMGVFFIAAGLGNMLLQITRIERLFTLWLSITGIVYIVYKLWRPLRRKELKERSILYFILFVFLCQLTAVALNCFGRFNLAKTFFVSGYSGVVIAIMFLWVVRLINEGLTLALGIYKKPNRELFFVNFNRVGSEAPTFFYVMLVLGWFFLVGKNFYGFKQIYEAFVASLTQQRSIGSYNFSIMGLVVFLTIMILSLVLSKLVSFFTSDAVTSHEKDKHKKKVNLASYMLLIRIFIICAGLFFAFAAAGIALDRITVIFGALSVGIGLGLQGLANNLVSGLIISFERPVNVGDLIEVNDKMVTMKSIGFRSSIVTSADGSHIVIPNGELLNQHLVNWTMGAHLKRNTFIVGVAYGSDLKQVKSIIMKILNDDKRILRDPEFSVVIKDFNVSSIDIEVIFWPNHISMLKSIKSDIIEQIDEIFRANGIVIPVPQQDVFIKALPDNDKKNDAKPGAGVDKD